MNRKAEGEPLVYVTGERALDFGPATVYGKLHVMSIERIVPYVESLPPHMAFNTRLTHDIRRELQDYIPDFDYICPVGAPVVMAAVGMVLHTLGPVHRLLGWDNHQRRYLEYRIKL